jgi:hypothetical protein
MFKSIITLSLLLAAFSSQAGQLAGRNVLLIQGFLPFHVFNPTDDQGKADGFDYWKTFKLYNDGNGLVYNRDGTINEKGDPNARILYFDSSSRIEEPSSNKLGTGINVATQLKNIFEEDPDFCGDVGCVVLTHSTGDLVMRYIMDNTQLLGAQADNLNVVAFVDMAGAGGGTEGATWLWLAANGANVAGWIVEGLSQWLGGDLSLPDFEPGILYDLIPNVARNTSVNHIPAIPKLRIAASGTELYGIVSHAFIKGKDDSVVPLHSACGASDPKAFDSCTRDLRIDGRVMNGVNGPSSFYNFHYPIIMSEKMPHNDMFKAHGWTWDNKVYPWYVTGRDMTFALSGANNYKNGSANQSVKVDVESKTVYAWWDWFRKYRFISNADKKSMGQVIIDSFE